MKKGDKVVCIKKWQDNTYIVNKTYTVTKYIKNKTSQYYFYQIDNQYYFLYTKKINLEDNSKYFLYNFDNYFKTLKELRKEKLNKINENIH